MASASGPVVGRRWVTAVNWAATPLGQAVGDGLMIGDCWSDFAKATTDKFLIFDGEEGGTSVPGRSQNSSRN